MCKVELSQAHAHDDYEHDRPLLDALEHGFTSVEADIWLGSVDITPEADDRKGHDNGKVTW